MSELSGSLQPRHLTARGRIAQRPLAPATPRAERP